MPGVPFMTSFRHGWAAAQRCRSIEPDHNTQSSLLADPTPSTPEEHASTHGALIGALLPSSTHSCPPLSPRNWWGLALFTASRCDKALVTLTQEEFHHLAQELREPVRTMAIVAICTGLRISEVLALGCSILPASTNFRQPCMVKDK